MYVCSLCNRTFSNQGSLKRHRESVHRQSAGYSCHVCSQRFYRKDALQRHIKMHRPAEFFSHSASCPTDTMVDLPLPLPPSPPLERHGKTPMCDVCAKTFASQKTLKKHWQTVHRQSGGFLCWVCDRRFYRTDHLKRHHIRKHADEEYEAPASHTCPICQKSFHYGGHLREHLKTHPVIATSSSATCNASHCRHQPSLSALSHDCVRSTWRLGYWTIAGSVLLRIGLRFVHANGVEGVSWCTVGDWRRLVTLGTCCGPSSAARKMLSRSTCR